jgi:hypothetical protein
MNQYQNSNCAYHPDKNGETKCLSCKRIICSADSVPADFHKRKTYNLRGKLLDYCYPCFVRMEVRYQKFLRRVNIPATIAITLLASSVSLIIIGLNLSDLLLGTDFFRSGILRSNPGSNPTLLALFFMVLSTSFIIIPSFILRAFHKNKISEEKINELKEKREIFLNSSSRNSY